MAIYRAVQMTFWTDAKVIDDFTPEDRYFYLYLMTNPHTNLAGCYELSMSTMATETGYTKEVIEKLIARMENTHDVIRYSTLSKEVLILNWSKYNWTSSPKFRTPLEKEIELIKNTEFKRFLKDLFSGIDTVSIPYPYGSDTSVTVTVLNNNTFTSLEEVKPIHKTKKNNTSNIYTLLDDSDLDIEIKENIRQWTEYKKEQFKFEYKPIGFKALLTEVSNQVQAIGVRKTIEAIHLSMGKGYKGIIWDLVKGNNSNTNNYGTTNKVAQQLYDSYQMMSDWANSKVED